MATIVLSGKTPSALSNIFLHSVWNHSESVFENNANAIVSVPGGTLAFAGNGFASFDAHGYALEGTIESLGLFSTDSKITVSDLSISAAEVEDAVKHAENQHFTDLFFGGDDDITCARAASHVSGFGGDDTINGGRHGDILYGGTGGDTLKGARGADELRGEAGTDTMTGGAGVDKFVFVEVSDSRKSGPDTITDLHNGDIIDLHQIDADSTSPGTDESFTLVHGFSGTPGELTVHFDAVNNRTEFWGDVDGDAKADLVIRALGNHADYTNFDLTG